MRILQKVTIYLMTVFMTASASIPSVRENKGGHVNINCNKSPVSQMAYHGSSVTIDCKYPKVEESNTKHFCREDENFHCTNLISTYTANHTIRNRFSLIDNKQEGVYTVIISTLTQDDAGRYRCVSERADSSTACLTDIQLHILNWDDITAKTVNHSPGQIAQIECHYPNSHESNEKFLCKGENPSSCEKLIHTTDQQRYVVKGRLHMRDNRRKKYFYVSISNLSTDDSGSYWCGSSKTWEHAEYTKILLSVAERPFKTRESRTPALQTTDSSTSQEDAFYELQDKAKREIKTEDSNESESSRNEDGQHHMKPEMIAAVVVCLALSLILVLVLVLCRHKLPRTQVCCAAGRSPEQRTNAEHNTEGNNVDHNYEEIQMQNQQANSRDTLPSVYATVNLPADQLHYASVNLQKDSASVSTGGNSLPVMNKNGSSACEYSSISTPQGATHPPEAEQTLYSTVTNLREP